MKCLRRYLFHDGGRESMRRLKEWLRGDNLRAGVAISFYPACHRDFYCLDLRIERVHIHVCSTLMALRWSFIGRTLV
jgi:hypothetical protein